MLELNRLRTMPEAYDERLFNKLYSKTENLRQKLARGIDSRRFGLCHEDVVSFFDVKFIFVFSKHHEKDEQILLGFILNSLRNFKCRILRAAYTNKFSQNITSVENLITLEDEVSHDPLPQPNNLDKMMDYMKEHLSPNAYMVLDIKLNPPPYILKRINTSPDANLQKIPDHLILDYLDLGTSEKSYKYFDSLKKEIKNAIAYAKTHFQPLLN